MMKRRTMIGLATLLTGGLLTIGAGAWAFGSHGGRHAVMKRYVNAEIEEALDRVGATAAQRATVHAARDRAVAAFEDHARSRRARMDQVLAAFEADQLDPVSLDTLRRQVEDEHRRIGDAVTAALVEVHAALTPQQRHALADHVRARRRAFMH